MAPHRTRSPKIRAPFFVKFFLPFLISISIFLPHLRAALSFDVLIGYDGVVPQSSWFPVVCDVRNDGPPLDLFFEITPAQLGGGQTRRIALELPPNTRKRVSVPMFSSSRSAAWNFRLLDANHKVHAEQLNTRPRRQSAWDVPMLAALSRTVSGAPIFPAVKSTQEELQPTAARLQPAIFPDNPIMLDGLNALYLNSEAALNLKAPQRNALLAWLNNGGHLIVNVEQLADLSGSAWLEKLLPVELVSTAQLKPTAEFQNWLQQGGVKISTNSLIVTNEPGRYSNRRRSPPRGVWGPNPFSELIADEKFARADLLVFTGKRRDGTALVSAAGTPLMVQAPRGRGKITLLTFSAEREPFLSWTNRAWFWAKLAEIPTRLYQSSDYNFYGGRSIDGVFGSMIDSKQIRKLPLGWLLLLLLVYLAVIGPLDQYWLKKINRQMLTWLTFPAYVLIFSALIYFIGFQLRAGDSEFNELHVVDILPREGTAVLRGRTYASIYSPSNKRYAFVSDQPFATLRGEAVFGYNAADEANRAVVLQRGNNFVAEVSVPVWTSQLYISDWLEPSATPLKISAARAGDDWNVTVENQLDRKLSETRVIVSNRVYVIGDLPAKQAKKIRLAANEGTTLKEFVRQSGGNFFGMAQSRRQTFGHDQAAGDLPESAMAASFSSQLNEPGAGQFFIAPRGLDLSRFTEQPTVIVLAWDDGHSFTKPLNHFSPRRSHGDTLLRLVAPLETSTPP